MFSIKRYIKQQLENRTFFMVKFTKVTSKFIGHWYDESKPANRVLRMAIMLYGVFAMTIGMLTLAVDSYVNRRDFIIVADNTICTIILIVVSMKVVQFLLLRRDISYSINYAENNFWNVTYGIKFYKIILGYERKGFICFFVMSISCIFSVLYYIFRPFLESSFKRGADRALPFKFYLPLPLLETPYFETTYTFQGVIVLHIGVCSQFHDFLIMTFVLHLIAQFEILTEEFECIADKYADYIDANGYYKHEKLMKETFNDLKMYINRHKALIAFCDKMEHIFNKIFLFEISLPSIAICLCGYQIMMTESTLEIVCKCFLMACGVSQILMHSLLATDILNISMKIGSSAFRSQWYMFPHEEQGKYLKESIILLTLRSQKPCVLTVGKFGVLSTATFTSVMSTAMSYLAVLRTVVEKEE